MASDTFVVFDTVNCTGCKTCEIACSYHHKEVFSPSISAIEVKPLSKEGESKIKFYTKNDSGHFACDRCKEEKEPFCVKYCNGLAPDELRGFLKQLAK